jgi:hypothetical protein
MQEVVGSIPSGSTNPLSNKLTVFCLRANSADISGACVNGYALLRSLRRRFELYIKAILGQVSGLLKDFLRIRIVHGCRPVRQLPETGSIFTIVEKCSVFTLTERIRF